MTAYEPMAEENGSSLGRLLELSCIAAVIYACLHFFACESIYIASGSMEPRLRIGTHAFLDKITVRLRSPRRDEIISFLAPTTEHEEMVKRVIGIAGDVVEIREKKVFLNGAELVEYDVQHTRPNERLVGDNLPSMTVPLGHLFVLGDNRDESNDSSVWKDPKTGEPTPFVPISDVRGIVRGFY